MGIVVDFCEYRDKKQRKMRELEKCIDEYSKLHTQKIFCQREEDYYLRVWRLIEKYSTLEEEKSAQMVAKQLLP